MSITKISPSVVDFDDGITISTADNTSQLILTSTDADANVGPALELYRNSSSPADNDVLGTIFFYGEDGAGNKTEYARIESGTDDVSNNAEVGSLTIFTNNADTLTNNRFEINGAGLVINESGGNFDFRVESGGDDKQFTILGDKFGIGIGRYPENAYNGYSSIELGQQGIIMANDAGDDLWIASNLYLDSSANQNKKSTGASGLIKIDGDVATWFTAASGSADTQNSWTARVRLDSDGIKFGSDTATANALNDYEEGSFTIGVTGATASLGNATAYYTKIGDLVYFFWYSGSSTFSSASGTATLTGLPFTQDGQTSNYGTFQFVHGNGVDGSSTGGYITNNSTQANFIDAGGVGGASFNNGSSQYIMVSGIYKTDA